MEGISHNIRQLKFASMGITEEVMKEMIAVENMALVVDLSDGLILYSTPQADLMFGYLEGELQGKMLPDLIPERFRERHEHHFKEYSANPTKKIMGQAAGIKLIGLKKDGTEFGVEIGLNAKAKYGIRFGIARLTPKREGA